MKKVLFLLVLLQSINYCKGQTIVTDSIKQRLLTAKDDTSRVLALCDLSFQYLESKPDTAMALALKGLSLANRIGFETGKAKCLTAIGNVNNVLGNYPKAMEAYLQSLQINEKIKNLAGKATNLNNIGTIYRDQRDYRLALDYFLNAKAMYEQLNSTMRLSGTLSNIEVCYFYLKNYDSASYFALQAYNVAYRINYARIIGQALSEMGYIDLELKHNTLALEHYRLSFPYIKKADSYNELCQAYLGISKAFEMLLQTDSALYYAKKSMVIAKEKGFIYAECDAARYISHYYRYHNADSAFFYQDISKAANDSFYNQQKQAQFQRLSFDEKLRQQEIAALELKEKEERKHNLQDAIIIITIITFVILFLLLSRSIIVKARFIEFCGILGLLAVFEFINLLIHPYLSRLTDDSHFLMLAILIALGALLIPLHHKLEKWITKIMVEKNKKIRLAAAKKTIATLEG